PDTLMAVNNIGLLRQAQGRFTEAEAIHREALAGYRRVLGDDHPFTIQRFSNVATAMAGQGRMAEAEELLIDVVAAARAIEPIGWRLGTYLMLHAHTLIALQQFERAEADLLEAQHVFAGALGDDHSYTSELSAAFARLDRAWRASDPERARGPIPVTPG